MVNSCSLTWMWNQSHCCLDTVKKLTVHVIYSFIIIIQLTYLHFHLFTHPFVSFCSRPTHYTVPFFFPSPYFFVLHSYPVPLSLLPSVQLLMQRFALSSRSPPTPRPGSGDFQSAVPRSRPLRLGRAHRLLHRLRMDPVSLCRCWVQTLLIRPLCQVWTTTPSTTPMSAVTMTQSLRTRTSKGKSIASEKSKFCSFCFSPFPF